MFNEGNTGKQIVIDTLRGIVTDDIPAETKPLYLDEVKDWRSSPPEDLLRQPSDVFVESMVRDALIRLNPEIKSQPDRADEVLYRLRTIPLGVKSESLVLGNKMESKK